MNDRQLSARALAFQHWMEAKGTNTRRVSLKAQVPYTTLAAFVQGSTQSLKGNTEEKIAAAFQCSSHEIFARAEPAERPALIRIIGKVGADASGAVAMSIANDSWDMTPIVPGATSKAVALEVSGHSMNTFAPDGSLIYFENQQTPPDAGLYGVVCAVETEDGRILVKRLKRGSGPDLYNLESDFGPVIEDVRLVWAAEIIAIVPPRQARRIVIRATEVA